MRRGMRPLWLEVEGRVIGVNLGADYCAEHEFGINPLKRMLGIDGAKLPYDQGKPVYAKAPGLPRRLITTHECMRFYEQDDVAVLVCKTSWWLKRLDDTIRSQEGQLPSCISRELSGTEDLRTAWSNEDFGIVAMKGGIVHLRAIWEAALKNNIAVWTSGRSSPFENSGLVICIADLVPFEFSEMLRKGDEDLERLDAASEATGIHRRLEAAGRGYYACSPRWIDESTKSAHPVVFWLNPMDQQRNNFGWFTVEELDQWIAGTGPVPKASSPVEKES